jgi:hypothetical protein
LIRRVTGVLMHLVVFEVPHNLEDPHGQGQRSAPHKNALMNSPTSRSKHTGAADGSSITDDNMSLMSSIDGGAESVSVLGPGSPGHNENSADEIGFAEKRTRRSLATFEAPTLRVLGFDPVTKTKTALLIPAAACTEIAGGSYSHFLALDRRKELAGIICEALFLFYPRGKPFELQVNWSGSIKHATTEVVAAKGSWRASADRVVRRVGKIFRSMVRISGIQVLATVYMQPTLVRKRMPGSETTTAAGDHDDFHGGVDGAVVTAEEAHANEAERNQLMAGGDAGHYLAGTGGPAAESLQLIVNLYASECSEAAELVVSRDEQIQRLGKAVLEHNEGSVRAAACRKLLRYFRCSMHEDVENRDRQILHVSLY